MSLLLSTTSLLRPLTPSWLEDTCQKLVDNEPDFRTCDLTHPRIDDVYAKIFANALDENNVVNALTLSCFEIVDDGAYAMQTYKRTLSDLGMALEFTSVSDGATVRKVEARLTKRSN